MVREFEYALVWLPERHCVAGTLVELRSHCLRAFLSWQLRRVEVDVGDVVFRWKSRPTVSDMWTNRERVLVRLKLPYGARRGQPICFRVSFLPPIWAGIDQRLSVWTAEPAGAAPWQDGQPAPPATLEAGSCCELAVIAAPVERLSVYCRPAPGPDGNVRTVIVPEDRFGNPGRFESPVTAEIEWNGRRWPQPLQELAVMALETPAQPVARAVVSIPMKALALSENIANGRLTGDNLAVTGNPVWRQAVGGLRPAFGEFHWHTEFSGDGQRPIADALEAARNALNMDFAAPGDHSPAGEKWKATVAALEAAHMPGDFATFFGWESSTKVGHENFYFAAPDHPLVCGGAAGFHGGLLTELPEQLRERHDFLAIPHHTNAVSESRRLEDDTPFWYPYPWGEPRDFRRLVEIFQTRGNQERNEYDDAWRGWHQHHGASVQDALAAGHRLGFVGGTDNHCGWPGRAFAECEGSGKHPAKSVILTGAWVESVDRQPVVDALCARRTWAVWDTRAIAWFTVNDVPAGGELSVAPGTALSARLRLSAEAPLQSIEIVADGATVWSGTSVDTDVDMVVPLGKAERPAYYYLRALERSGGLIYASPVFVTPDRGDDTLGDRPLESKPTAPTVGIAGN
jgi:hypothetical protein